MTETTPIVIGLKELIGFLATIAIVAWGVFWYFKGQLEKQIETNNTKIAALEKEKIMVLEQQMAGLRTDLDADRSERDEFRRWDMQWKDTVNSNIDELKKDSKENHASVMDKIDDMKNEILNIWKNK